MYYSTYPHSDVLKKEMNLQLLEGARKEYAGMSDAVMAFVKGHFAGRTVTWDRKVKLLNEMVNELKREEKWQLSELMWNEWWEGVDRDLSICAKKYCVYGPGDKVQSVAYYFFGDRLERLRSDSSLYFLHSDICSKVVERTNAFFLNRDPGPYCRAEVCSFAQYIHYDVLRSRGRKIEDYHSTVLLSAIMEALEQSVDKSVVEQLIL